ncbi:MAG: HEAT repeat domain-containing protein [Planctomycetota bacterium]|jgi:hypothetical protein
MRYVSLLLLAAVAAAADRDADYAVAMAIRDYNFLLTGRGGSDIHSVTGRMIANLPKCSAKYRKSICRQLNNGFKTSYPNSKRFQKQTAQMLAAGGKNGISTLYRRYKSSSKRRDLREDIASALGGCGDDDALETLLKMIHDKDPDVAAAAVAGCGSFPKVKVERRKKALRQLIDRYKTITDDAAGKDAESPQLKMYKKVKPAMNATLQAMSGGEALDSALAWDAWLRERMKKPWTE